MQNLPPCGYVMHSISAFSKPNNQGPSAEKSEACVEDVDLPMLKKYNYYLKTAFYTPLVCLSCNQVATSCMRLATTQVHFACNYHSVKTICDWLPVACKFFHSLAASSVLIRQFFYKHAAWIRKIKSPLKNLRIYATCVLAKAYPLTLSMARYNLVRQFL
jgi:hypothetical protein